MDFDLNTIISMLRAQLEKDLEDPYIHKPYAHALYHVWKVVDIQEKPKSKDVDDWTWKRNGKKEEI